MKIETIQNGIYIVGETELKVEEVVLSQTNTEEELFVRKTNIEGIFTYGCKQLSNEYMGHGAGYIWSSRASVMNSAFDVALKDVYYKKEGTSTFRSCAIDLAHLEPLLEGTEYKIDWTPHKSSDGVDVSYRLIKKEVNE